MKWNAEPRILRQPVHLFAFGFGAGLIPYAPGTFGTAIGLLLVLTIEPFGFMAHVIVASVAAIGGMYICGESARRLDVHDHSGIVWDEITGYLITMLAIPSEPAWLAAGFVLFRFFDIVKPWPIREADHSLQGGLGIMLDDVLAGFFAGGILYLLYCLL